PGARVCLAEYRGRGGMSATAIHRAWQRSPLSQKRCSGTLSPPAQWRRPARIHWVWSTGFGKGGVGNVSDQTLSMLERRRIEGGILKHVYDTLRASHGEKVATHAIADAVRRSAIEQASQMAAAVGGNTSMETFIDRQEAWTRGGALTIKV